MASNIRLPDDACAVSNLSDAIDKAAALGVNMTVLVSKCPLLCDVAYGTGNPDLSGIGVNASYVILPVLSVLSAVLAIFAIFSPGLPSKLPEWIVRLQRTFMDMAAVFAISVGVANIIWTQQIPSLYELICMAHLGAILWLCLFVTILSQPRILPQPIKDLVKYISVNRVILSSIYLFGSSGVFISVVSRSWSNDSLWNAIEQFQPCKVYEDAGLKLGGSRHRFLFSFVGLCLLTMLYTLFVLGMVILLRLKSRLLAKLNATEQPPSDPLLVKVGYFVTVLRGVWVILLVLATFFIIFFTVKFQQTRNAMKRAVGGKFQDESWGFGQVIALFVWAPLLLAFIPPEDQQQQDNGTSEVREGPMKTSEN